MEVPFWLSSACVLSAAIEKSLNSCCSRANFESVGPTPSARRLQATDASFLRGYCSRPRELVCRGGNTLPCHAVVVLQSDLLLTRLRSRGYTMDLDEMLSNLTNNRLEYPTWVQLALNIDVKKVGGKSWHPDPLGFLLGGTLSAPWASQWWKPVRRRSHSEASGEICQSVFLLPSLWPFANARERARDDAKLPRNPVLDPGSTRVHE